jgi:hypothetical protein
MSKQTLLFSFLDKSKRVNVKSKLKGAEQEVNKPVGKNRAACTKNMTILTLHSVSLKHVDSETRKLQCVVCGDVLSNDVMKPSKLTQHLNTRHSEPGKKPKEYSERKQNELKVQQKLIFSATTTSEAALKASYKLELRTAKSKKPFTNAEELIMHAA